MSTVSATWESWEVEDQQVSAWERVDERTITSDPLSLDAAIESAEGRLLKLGDNWDDEGSTGYEQEVLIRAAIFLRAQNKSILELFKGEAPVPKITPGPDGSIDLFWEQPSWELLVNIPANKARPASYYGEDSDGAMFKGSFNVLEHKIGLLAWLMK